MATYTRGVRAPGICERCGLRWRLSQLAFQVEGGKRTDLLVCPDCLDVDNPQLLIGRLRVSDPQHIRRPAPPREVELTIGPAPVATSFTLDVDQLDVGQLA